MRINIKIKFSAILVICFNSILTAQQPILRGKVLEINSGRTPIPFVQIKSDNGASAVKSDSKGDYTLTFQDQAFGSLVYVEAQKKGYELVNTKAMRLFLPEAKENQKINLEIILCKQGYLDQARLKYYEITNKYIKAEFQRRYNQIIAKKKEGWEKERLQLQEKMDNLEEQLKNQVEDYIRTNRDELSKKELLALKLFEEGKLDESLEVRASMNSEQELRKELENNQRAKENKAKAEKELIKSEKGIETSRRNLKAEADGLMLKMQFDLAEKKLKSLAKIDSLNFESVFHFAGFLFSQDKGSEAVTYFHKSLKLAKKQISKIKVYSFLGVLFWSEGKGDTAKEHFLKAIRIYNKLSEYEHQKHRGLLIDNFYNLGVLYQKNEPKDAEIFLDFAIEIINKSNTLSKWYKEKRLASIESTKARIAFYGKDFALAEKLYSNAKKRIASLLDSGLVSEVHDESTSNGLVELDLGLVSQNLGQTYLELNSFILAEDNLHLALSIFENKKNTVSPTFQRQCALTEFSLGLLYKKISKIKGDDLSAFDKSISFFEKSLKKYRSLSEYNKSKYENNELEVYWTFSEYADKYINELNYLLNKAEFDEKHSIQKKIVLANLKFNALKLYDFDVLDISEALGGLSYYLLFVSNFSLAEENAKQALNPSFEKPKDYDKKIEWVNTNLALALLYQGKYEDAKEIYVRLKDKPYGNATYNEAFLEDLNALEKEGITHPDVVKIRKLLNK